MQATHYTASREGLVVLYKVNMPHMGIKLRLLEYLAEVTPLVTEAFWFDNPNTLDILFEKGHALSFCRINAQS